MSNIKDVIIPEGWKIEVFDNILNKFQNWYAFNAKKYSEYWNPIIKMWNISLDWSFYFNENKTNYCNSKEYKSLKTFWVKYNDLLIAMTDVTPNKDLIWRATIVDIDKDFILNQRVWLLKVKEDFYNKVYLKYYCNFDYFRNYSKSMSWLSAQANLWTEDIKNAKVLLPKSLQEQEKIAEILSTVDEAIEKTDSLIEKYKKIKTWLMEDLFTKWIDVNTWNPHTKFKDSELGKIPESWETEILGNISEVTKLAWFEFTKHIVYKDTWTIIALRGLNIKNSKLVLNDVKYIDESDFSKLSRSKLYINDLMFTYVWTIWEVALIKENDKFYLAPNVARIRIQKKNISHIYINQYFNYSKFKNKIISKYIASSSQPALSMENMREFSINLPSLKEQEKIAEILSEADNKIEKEEAYKEKLEKIKKWLMKDLLTGKVRVKY